MNTHLLWRASSVFIEKRASCCRVQSEEGSTKSRNSIKRSFRTDVRTSYRKSRQQKFASEIAIAIVIPWTNGDAS